MKTYSTSEIAKIVGIHRNTVILYEKWGYIAPVERKENGYRVYTETHLEQVKIVRMALRNDRIKCYMRFEVKKIIKSVAQGDLEQALELSRLYLIQIQNEKENELKVLKLIQEILKGDSCENHNLLLNRSEVANLMGVSINVIINWERNGLIEVPRSKNGYRVYGEKEIKQLRIIKALRKENYSTHHLWQMLHHLKAITKENDLFLSEPTEECLLSSLGEVESQTEELIAYLEEKINDLR